MFLYKFSTLYWLAHKHLICIFLHSNWHQNPGTVFLNIVFYLKCDVAMNLRKIFAFTKIQTIFNETNNLKFFFKPSMSRVEIFIKSSIIYFIFGKKIAYFKIQHKQYADFAKTVKNVNDFSVFFFFCIFNSTISITLLLNNNFKRFYDISNLFLFI